MPTNESLSEGAGNIGQGEAKSREARAAQENTERRSESSAAAPLQVGYSLIAESAHEGRGAMVIAALEDLDHEARQVFALRYRCTLHAEEIAQATGLTPGHVRRVLSSGSVLLLERLAFHDAAFLMAGQVDLHRLLRSARPSDILPSLRLWAERTIPAELRERSASRKRAVRAAVRRRATRRHRRGTSYSVVWRVSDRPCRITSMAEGADIQADWEGYDDEQL